MFYYLHVAESHPELHKILFPTLVEGHWFLLEHDLDTGEVVSHNSLATPTDEAPSSDDVYFSETHPLGKQNFVAQFLRRDRPATAV